MFSDNLINLRKIHHLTQEDVAEKVGVTRQSVAKWESGESVPDLDKCRMLADLFRVSLDDLANYEPEDNMGLSVPPRGKHLFGLVTVGDKGQIVIHLWHFTGRPAGDPRGRRPGTRCVKDGQFP